MKNTRTYTGFKVVMGLIGLFSIYAALFISGNKSGLMPMTVSVGRRHAPEARDRGVKFYRALIIEASRSHNVPPALVAAIMHAESDFNPKAVSPAGARGLMQINDITQRHLGVRNIFDPRENVHGGARYIKELLDSHRGNTRLAVASYNAGPGAVRKFGGIPPYRETRRYVVKVMSLYDTYRREFPNKSMLTDNAANYVSGSS